MSSRLVYGYLIGGLLLGLIYFLTIPLYEKKIPTTLENHVQEQLNTQGYSWAKASANGRDITLQGKAPTLASYDEALDLTRSISTVRSVNNQLKHTVISPYSLSAEWKDKELKIKGHLPSQKSMTEVNEVLKTMYGKGKVVSQLTVGKGAPDGWSDLTKTALENTPQLDRVNIDIVDNSLDLSAKTARSIDSDRLMNALKPFEAQGYTLTTNVVAEDVAAKRCQKRFNQLLKTTSISFNSGKTSINSKSIPLLQTLADTAQLCPGLGIIISGHTDNRGSAAKNQSLSKQRAEAVATWLISSGLDAKLLKTVGYGASKPIADNATESGRASNRRIEFTVQEK
jgi:OOP family OmpA-OmpF porin